MSKLVVNGGQALQGQVGLSGDQQTILATQAAAIMSTSGTVIVDNVPATAAIVSLNQLLENLGAVVVFDRRQHTLKMDAGRHLTARPLSGLELIAAGAVLARCREVAMVDNGVIPQYGQQIEEIANCLQQLGARVNRQNGGYQVEAQSLQGTSLDMASCSLTATLAIMMVATMAQGITVLHHPGQVPAIIELAKLLNKMGARVHGAGTDTIRIQGVAFLHSTDFYALDDQEEAGVYLCLGALTAGDVFVKGAQADHLQGLIKHLEAMGNTLVTQRQGIRIIGTHVLLPANLPAPQAKRHETSLQAVLAVLHLYAQGPSQLTCPSVVWQAISAMIIDPDSSLTYQAPVMKALGTGATVSSSLTVRDGLSGIIALSLALAAHQQTVISPAERVGEAFDHLLDQLIEINAKMQLSFD